MCMKSTCSILLLSCILTYSIQGSANHRASMQALFDAQYCYWCCSTAVSTMPVEPDCCWKSLQIAVLVFAIETMYFLPYGLPSAFRPVFMAVFNLRNEDMGEILALYGTVTMLAYLPGGFIADRFSARSLMCVSLIASSLCCSYLASLPSSRTSLLLTWAALGVSNNLLFYCAFIRAVRESGGKDAQGRTFGLISFGRGLWTAMYSP